MKNVISKYVERIEYNNRIILANYVTGQWIRLEKEVFNIIDVILRNDLPLMDIEFEEEKDVAYIREILDDLTNMGIIVECEKEPIIQNKVASVELTSRCNLKCIHCCVDATYSMNEKMDSSTEEIKEIFRKLAKWNPKSIMLSGGEPMLRKDFFELLIYLREIYTGNIILSTNATFITKSNVGQLVELVNQFDISVDGVDEESCAVVRGKGVFKRIMESILLLKERQIININLSMVIGDNNEYMKKEFELLNESLGTRPFIRMFSAVGRGEANKEYFTAKSEGEVYIPKEYGEVNIDVEDHICCCSGGSKELFISNKGDMYPCPGYIDENYKLGNIFNYNSVEEATWNIDNRVLAHKYKTSEKSMYKKCIKCPVRIFCWSCPAAIEEIENPDAFAYQCKTIEPILMKRIWED